MPRNKAATKKKAARKGHRSSRNVTPPGLTAQQRRAATLLSHGRRATDVAEELGVARETVCRWRQIEEFRELELDCANELVQATHRDALSRKDVAFRVLEDLAMGKKQDGGDPIKDGIRLAAASKLAELAVRVDLAALQRQSDDVASVVERSRDICEAVQAMWESHGAPT